MKWLRIIAGQQPELRIIAALLALIAYLLFQVLKQGESIESSMPYVENCGGWGNPCEVEITNRY